MHLYVSEVYMYVHIYVPEVFTSKYTKTACDEVRKYPTCVIFLKSQGSKDIKHDILDCQIHKYKCTNIQIQIHKTQIQHMTEWQKYPTYAIFLNSWWFKDEKNDNPKCSNSRYTVDFCTVPPGLFHLTFIWFSFDLHLQNYTYISTTG